MDKIVTIIVSVILSLIAAGVVAETVAPHQVQQAVGALAGPVIPSPFLMWGQVASYNARQSLVQATTTVCAIKTPEATSTLENFNFQLENGGTVTPAGTLSIATSSTAFATSSGNTALLANQSVAASTTQTLSVVPSINNDNILAPNSWVIAKFVNTSAPAGGYSQLGECQMQTEAIR